METFFLWKKLGFPLAKNSGMMRSIIQKGSALYLRENIALGTPLFSPRRSGICPTPCFPAFPFRILGMVSTARPFVH